MGSGARDMMFRRAMAVLAGLVGAVITLDGVAAEGPTVEEYLAAVGSEATVVPYGKLRIDGRRATCGKRSTIIDPTLDDYGAAYPRFLILNPKKLEGLATPVKLWIFSHECAHQFRGPDEKTADCFAVQRGRRQGWLDNAGLEEICNFIRPARGDVMHFSGPERCAVMKQCYLDRSKVY